MFFNWHFHLSSFSTVRVSPCLFKSRKSSSKESLLIRDLKPALNENVGSENIYLYY